MFTEKLKDLENKTSLAVVKVKSSCIHKVSKLLFDAYKCYIVAFIHFVPSYIELHVCACAVEKIETYGCCVSTRFVVYS